VFIERGDPWHFKCAAVASVATLGAPRTIGREQTEHIRCGVAIDPPFPAQGSSLPRRAARAPSAARTSSANMPGSSGQGSLFSSTY